MAAACALAMFRGMDIFICSSETPAGVSELLFHGRGYPLSHLAMLDASSPKGTPTLSGSLRSPAPPKGELISANRQCTKAPPSGELARRQA